MKIEEITLNEKTYKIKTGVKWKVLSKITTALQNGEYGDAVTHAVVGQCIEPKYSYKSIDEEEGPDILLIGGAILRKLNLTEEMFSDLKNEEDSPSD